MLSVCLRSAGTPLQDEVGHLVIARDAWLEPVLILNEWGRIANTLTYMPSAPFGLQAARIESVLLSAVTVWLTLKVAQQLGIRTLWVVPLLIWLQPWFVSLSFLAITEVPLALLSILGVYLALRQRPVLAGLVIGVLPLARHEAVVLVGLWLALCIARRQFVAALVTLLPEILYNAASLIVRGTLPMAIYLTPTPTELYGSGGWLHFLPGFVLGVGIPVLLLAIVGAGATFRRRSRPLLVILAWYAAYAAVHVIAFRFGLFASAGYDLFLLPLAVPSTLLAAVGAETLLADGSRFRNYSRALAHVSVIATLVAAAVVMPYAADAEQTALEQASNWVRQQHPGTENVVATHVWAYYFVPLRVPATTDLWAGLPPPDQLPSGTVMIWDAHYSERWGWSWAALTAPDSPWRELRSFGEDQAVVFRKD